MPGGSKQPHNNKCMESFYNLPDGCSKYMSCGSCPFPDCRASNRDLLKGDVLTERHQRILDMHSHNVPARVIGQRTGLHIRSIYRIIRERR
jgi:hypothetical protein